MNAKSTHILNYVSTLFAVNGLSLNIKKTHALHFEFNLLQNHSFQIFLNQGIGNKDVTNIKYLGFGLDQHMEWKTHVELMLPKTSSACYAFSSVYSFTDMTTL